MGIFLIFIIGISGYLIFNLVFFSINLLHAIKVAKRTLPFGQISGPFKIGVFGDSTAVGVGASKPENSLAGLLGQSEPQSTIVNLSKNGSCIGEVTSTLENQAPFDLLLICCGGMDILYLKNDFRIRKDISGLLAAANAKANKVILITPLNLGLSPAFPYFLRKLFLYKSKSAGRIFTEEADKYSKISICNNLEIESGDSMPPWQKISAFDKIHPNDEGYRWVFEKIKYALP